jgi:TM2 domain-containing protein
LRSAESRWLGASGLVLITTGLALFGVFEDDLFPDRWFDGLHSGEWPRLVGLCLLGANTIIFGLAALLTGAAGLSLRHDGDARRAAAIRIAASNLLLPCVAFAAASETPAWQGWLEERDWHVGAAFLVLVLFIYLARSAILLFRSSWRFEAPTAAETLAADDRAPVLYLRSFAVDDELLVAGNWYARLLNRLRYTDSVSPEQELAWALARVGPVFAISRPGERRPQLGATRIPVHGDNWQDTVSRHIAQSALVCVRAGNTAGLLWELERVTAPSVRGRTLIVGLGPAEAWGGFRRQFVEAFGEPACDELPRQPEYARYLSWLFPATLTIGSLIYFTRGAWHERPLAATWSVSTLARNIVSTSGAALQSGLGPVLSQLGFSMRDSRRSLPVAILLAYFGGIVGLHHFYLGRRRKGVLCCMFFWTAVPLILGMIDAFRLALSTNPLVTSTPAGAAVRS